MRNLRRALAVVALASLVLVVGCSSTPTPAGSTGGTGAAPTTVAVSLKGTAFVPADITVAVGGTVTFTNDDSFEHSIAGDSWSSGAMVPGSTFSQTFATAGTFPIRCTIHPSMTGTVNVK